ncbi:MAG: CDP-alcohol phosphatidyltransferase family protein [Chloroflexota bacterium]|nr:CDP-alcohol phosphatidyltransferase family protein [Chloroflexota bacterium]
MENTYQESPPEDWSPSKLHTLLAWLTHLFTASGAIWGLLTILAISNEQWVLAFTWMAASIFVDSFDGLLARRVRVKSVLPDFDGALLDNMVDFLNYVFVPAYFLYEAEILPQQYALAGAVLILLASAYQFCQDDAKTDDHYFTGFPSYWNIMVYYMFLLSLNGWINLSITVLLTALIFVPIKYVYPSRTKLLQKLTMALAGVWGVVNIIILTQYPVFDRWLVWASLLFAVYYCGLSFYAMFKDRKATAR